MCNWFSDTSTECARDRDLHKFESYGKFVNEKLFCIIYKTLYLTLGHHALSGILCLCLNFLWVINCWIVLTKSKKPKKFVVQYFCIWRSRSLAHPVEVKKKHYEFAVRSFVNFDPVIYNCQSFLIIFCSKNVSI